MRLTYFDTAITDIKKFAVEKANAKKNNKCPDCGYGSREYQTYVTDNMTITDTCFLCHIIRNFNKSYAYYCTLGYSQMSQQDIIRKTYKFYGAHNRIPLPTAVDPDMERVTISSCTFAQFANEQQLPIKVFFTMSVKNKLDSIISQFDDSDTDTDNISELYNKLTLTDYYTCNDTHTFSTKENAVISSEILKIKQRNVDTMHNIIANSQ